MTALRGQQQFNVSLKKYTSWKIGGCADEFYTPADLDDLQVFLQQHPLEKPLFFLGLGSNVLVGDGGIRGTVIHTHKALQQITACGKQRWRIEAGVVCAKIARLSKKNASNVAEFLIGIPATFGGALAMNAGAFGGETWALVDSVETIDRHGVIRQRCAKEYQISYRQVIHPVKNEYFVSATIDLTQHSDNAIDIKTLLQKRKASQPLGLPSCGSVFRNPANHYAAQLIESLGLKGKQIGGAQISPKHANFIINTGNASANDVEQLIAHIQQAVEQKFGIQLQTEVHRVGQKII